MTIVESTTEVESDADEAVVDVEPTPVVEVLVEEISIDGMCGVY